MDLSVLEDRLQYRFQNGALLQQAVTHRSHGLVHNERLEFLGDSVLNCVVAQILFQKYARLNEGDLSRLRANLVKQQSLSEIAERLGLSDFLRLGEGEMKSGGTSVCSSCLQRTTPDPDRLDLGRQDLGARTLPGRHGTRTRTLTWPPTPGRNPVARPDLPLPFPV